jgi:hypothetical protein
LIGAYNTRFSNKDRLQLSLAARHSDAGFENIYDEYRAGLGYTFATPLMGTRWSSSFELGYRSYDEFATTLDGRRDKFATFGATAVFENFAYFGFSPSMSVTAERTISSAEEFGSSTIAVRFGVETNF